nr:uncharacterized protein LOC111505243 [Leptinotarsa decemlineata]
MRYYHIYFFFYKNMNMTFFVTVQECKEKWRNIRSSFLRSMKAPASGSKSKKPYYLKDYLQFILPYVKPVNNVENTGNVPEPPPEISNEDNSSANVASDSVLNNNHNENSQTASYNSEDETNQSEPVMTQQQKPVHQLPVTPASTAFQTCRYRKRQVTEGEKTFVDYLKAKTRKVQDGANSDSKPKTSHMHHFLLSLLPDLESMTEEQQRNIKLRIMILIDAVKSNHLQSHQYTHVPSQRSSTIQSVLTLLVSPDPSSQFSDTQYTILPTSPETEADVAQTVYSYFKTFNTNND